MPLLDMVGEETSASPMRYPISGQTTYLDTAGVGPMSERTLHAMAEYAAWYTTVGITRPWDAMEQMIADVRVRASQLLGCRPEECCPVHSCSDAVSSVAAAMGLDAGDNIVVSDVEYPSNLFPWLRYQQDGVEIRRIATRDGFFEAADVAALCDERTRAVAISHVSYLTGFRCDLGSVAEVAHAHGALCVVDATQSLGAVRVDVGASGVDVCVASGLKWLLAPIGTGIMFVRSDAVQELHPRAVSWMSMDDYRHKGPELPELAADARRFMTSGNISLSLYAGFLAATAELLDVGLDEIERRVLDLSQALVHGCAELGFRVHTSANAAERAGIVTVAVADVEQVLKRLSDAGIHAVARHDGVRFSAHHFISDAEIAKVLEVMHECG